MDKIKNMGNIMCWQDVEQFKFCALQTEILIGTLFKETAVSAKAECMRNQ